MSNREDFIVEAGGVPTHVICAGRPGRTVVLLHGGIPGHTPYMGGAFHWESVFGRFSNTGRVVALDLLGSGKTGYPSGDPITVEDMALHVIATIKALGLGKCHIVGHDIGGLVAIALAMDATDHVETISVVASRYSAPIGDAMEDLTFKGVPQPVYDRPGQYWVFDRLSFSNAHIDDALLDTAVEMAKSEGVLRAQSAMASLKAQAGFVSSYTRVRGRMWTLTRGAGIPVPVQIIWGRHDPTITIAHGHTMLKGIGRTQMNSQFHVLNNAGSFVFREQPESFHRVVTAFHDGIEDIEAAAA